MKSRPRFPTYIGEKQNEVSGASVSPHPLYPRPAQQGIKFLGTASSPVLNPSLLASELLWPPGLPVLPGAQGPSAGLCPCSAPHAHPAPRVLPPAPLLPRTWEASRGLWWTLCRACLQPQGPHLKVKAEALQTVRSGLTPARGSAVNLPPTLPASAHAHSGLWGGGAAQGHPHTPPHPDVAAPPLLQHLLRPPEAWHWGVARPGFPILHPHPFPSLPQTLGRLQGELSITQV